MNGVDLPQNHPVYTLTGDSPLVRQLRGQPSVPRPVWFMRQAGRSLPEYRAVRAGRTMLECCLDPATAAEITLQPVRRHGVDAAILFSDIVVPLRLAGLELEIMPGVGPVLAHPVRSPGDIAHLPTLSPDACAPVAEAVRLTVNELGRVPLIGFAGAPFTLASYLVEGAPSATLPYTRRLMNEAPAAWSQLLDWCAQVSATFLRAQVGAGASAFQVFDSWAGKLSAGEYVASVRAHSVNLFDRLADVTGHPKAPIASIHFGIGVAPFLSEFAGVGATALGVDGSLDLGRVAERFPSLALQGNLPTTVLSEPWWVIAASIDYLLAAGSRAAGHVVNLGHGVPPDTDPDVLSHIVDYVHEASAA